MSESAKRFYKHAAVTAGNRVALDERGLRTPGGAVFAVSTPSLAEAVADEWNGQRDHIVPASMPITQFAFAAIDWTGNSRSEIADYVASFGQTDLCCHRAEAPAELVERQHSLWDPLVHWGEQALGVKLPVVIGVTAAPVDAEVLAALRAHADGLDDFRLTALAQTVGLAGSALIGFALLRARLTPEQAFEAASLDNLWSQEKWGDDAEARARLDRQRADFEALRRFITLLDT